MFKEDDSNIHIIIATTVLSMGMDFSKVELVIQWSFLITKDIGDLIQRFGRGARRPGQRAVGILFVPYYAFNCLG